MRRIDRLRWQVVLATLLWGGISFAAVMDAPPTGEMKALGNDRYQIGRIVIDKTARSFKLPGRVILRNAPLEYLAGAPGGLKNYETLLELDSNSIEFNLACILIGLEAASDQPPYQQFSKIRLNGPRLALRVEWQEGDRRRTMSAAEALLNPEAGVKAESVEWVYTGRPAAEPGVILRDTGTLIGVVHDPHTLIESAEAIGVGAYGSVRGNSALPPVGTTIELTVEVLRNTR